MSARLLLSHTLQSISKSVSNRRGKNSAKFVSQFHSSSCAQWKHYDNKDNSSETPKVSVTVTPKGTVPNAASITDVVPPVAATNSPITKPGMFATVWKYSKVFIIGLVAAEITSLGLTYAGLATGLIDPSLYGMTWDEAMKIFFVDYGETGADMEEVVDFMEKNPWSRTVAVAVAMENETDFFRLTGVIVSTPFIVRYLDKRKALKLLQAQIK